MNGEGEGQPFTRRAIAALLVAGIVGAIGFLLLSAYGPDMKSGKDGGAHAMSVGATGFRVLYDLNAAVSGTSALIRGDDPFDIRGVMIITPPISVDAKALAKRVALHEAFQRSDEDEETPPTLIVLPKWVTMPDPAKSGWVRGLGPFAGQGMEAALSEVVPGKIEIRSVEHKKPAQAGWPDHPDVRFTLPKEGQSIQGAQLEPVIADPAGGALLAKVKGKPLYILAEPDVLDNMGMRDLATARAGLSMLDALSPSTAGLLSFDLVLNGFGRSPNLLKLAFEPPFLAATLCLFVAALFAGYQAAIRFGPPRREARAVAFGKAALLDSSAALIRRAGHAHRGGERYVALTREAVATAIGAPAEAEPGRLDAYLERLVGRGGHEWSELAERARRASSEQELVAAAQALHRWRKDVTRDRG